MLALSNMLSSPELNIPFDGQELRRRLLHRPEELCPEHRRSHGEHGLVNSERLPSNPERRLPHGLPPAACRDAPRSLTLQAPESKGVIWCKTPVDL